MATVNIPIFRQDYAQSGETPSQQFAGVEPNVFSPSLSGVTLASTSADKNLIGDPSYSTYGIDDFKDHKTIFTFINTLHIIISNIVITRILASFFIIKIRSRY